ncbi:MAG: outer membrane protein assembly factor BamB, partial [Pseudomonadota bacterium]
MPNKILLPILVCAVVGLSACTSAKKPQPAGLVNFTPTLSTTVAWKTEVGRTPKFDAGVGQFSPAVSGESVTAAASNGTVSRVNLADGKLIWRTQIGAPIIAGVAVGSGVTSGVSVVINDRGELVVIEANGNVARRIALGGVAIELPALLGNTAIVRLADNRIAGWDLTTGTRRWVIQRN